MQENQCAEEYPNHKGRQRNEVKFVEQTVTQRSDKKKWHGDWNSEAPNKKINGETAADMKDLMPSVKQITSDLKQVYETLNVNEGKGVELCLIFKECYETIQNAIQNSISPYLPEEVTLGTSLIPFDCGEHRRALHSSGDGNCLFN